MDISSLVAQNYAASKTATAPDAVGGGALVERPKTLCRHFALAKTPQCRP